MPKRLVGANDPALWPVLYAVPIVGMCLGLLWLSGWTPWSRGVPAAPEEAAA